MKSDKRIKKVALVGFSPATRHQAPFYDETFEIWGMNELYNHIPRFDRWFQLHNIGAVRSSHRDSSHLDWLRQSRIPIYMVKKYKDIPASQPYPVKDVVREFGSYFSCTASYMMALAILEGFDVIQLYGIEMATTPEYRLQRPSLEYFIGIAKGRGIDVWIPDESLLLKPPQLYGYEPSSLGQKLEQRLIMLRMRLDKLEKDLDFVGRAIRRLRKKKQPVSGQWLESQRKLNKASEFVRGQIEECGYCYSVWLGADTGEIV